jgi:hypothetical protein
MSDLRRCVAERVTCCDWSDFLQLAKEYEFDLILGSGSRRRRVHPTGLVVSVHEPHPRKSPVHPQAVKALLRAIDSLEGK